MKTFTLILAMTLSLSTFADATIEVNFGAGKIKGPASWRGNTEVSVVCSNADCSEIYFLNSDGLRMSRVLNKRAFTLKTEDYGMVKEPWRERHQHPMTPETIESFWGKDHMPYEGMSLGFLILSPGFVLMSVGLDAVILPISELRNLGKPGDMRARRLKKDLKRRTYVASVLNRVASDKETELNYVKFEKLVKIIRTDFAP